MIGLGLVEDQAQLAVRALLQRDVKYVPNRSPAGDLRIDSGSLPRGGVPEVLALYQPVAIDLRLVVAALKINNDLERIGDLAVNIARKAMAFAQVPFLEIPFDIGGMWEKTQAMLRDSFDALVNIRPRLAYQVVQPGR